MYPPSRIVCLIAVLDEIVSDGKLTLVNRVLARFQDFGISKHGGST